MKTCSKRWNEDMFQSQKWRYVLNAEMKTCSKHRNNLKIRSQRLTILRMFDSVEFKDVLVMIVWKYLTFINKRGKYKPKIQARSRNHCSCGKTVSSNHWVCVCRLSRPACKAHASYIDMWVLSGCTTFLHIVSQTARLSGGKKVIGRKMCVLIFSTTFV